MHEFRDCRLLILAILVLCGVEVTRRVVVIFPSNFLISNAALGLWETYDVCIRSRFVVSKWFKVRLVQHSNRMVTPFDQEILLNELSHVHVVEMDLMGEVQSSQHNRKSHLASTAPTPFCIVAVLDSGLSIRDYFLHTLQGYDFISDPLLAMDGDGRDPDPADHSYGPAPHGLQVAGIIAAKHWFGLTGIAPNTTINPVRVLGSGLRGNARDVADAVVWAAGGQVRGVAAQAPAAHVIVMAFAGRGQCPPYLQKAFDFAQSLGTWLLAAAGNHADSASNYFPANCRGVVSVGALSVEGVLETYSNTGANMAAPGGQYLVDALGAASIVGTSASVSRVAGHLALAASDSVKVKNTIVLQPSYQEDLPIDDTFYNERAGWDKLMVEAASYDSSRRTQSQFIDSYVGGNFKELLICPQSSFVKSIKVWYDSTSLTAIQMTCKDATNAVTSTFQYGGTCFSMAGPVDSLTGFSGFVVGFQSWIRYLTLMKAGAASWESTIGSSIQDRRDLSCPSGSFLIGFSIRTGYNCDARMDGIQTFCAPVSCPACNPGYYASICSTVTESTCLPCPVGTYNIQSGLPIVKRSSSFCV
jgi:hypothetical protein